MTSASSSRATRSIVRGERRKVVARERPHRDAGVAQRRPDRRRRSGRTAARRARRRSGAEHLGQEVGAAERVVPHVPREHRHLQALGSLRGRATRSRRAASSASSASAFDLRLLVRAPERGELLLGASGPVLGVGDALAGRLQTVGQPVALGRDPAQLVLGGRPRRHRADARRPVRDPPPPAPGRRIPRARAARVRAPAQSSSRRRSACSARAALWSSAGGASGSAFSVRRSNGPGERARDVGQQQAVGPVHAWAARLASPRARRASPRRSRAGRPAARLTTASQWRSSWGAAAPATRPTDPEPPRRAPRPAPPPPATTPARQASSPNCSRKPSNLSRPALGVTSMPGHTEPARGDQPVQRGPDVEVRARDERRDLGEAARLVDDERTGAHAVGHAAGELVIAVHWAEPEQHRRGVRRGGEAVDRSRRPRRAGRARSAR